MLRTIICILILGLGTSALQSNTNDNIKITIKPVGIVDILEYDSLYMKIKLTDHSKYRLNTSQTWITSNNKIITLGIKPQSTHTLHVKNESGDEEILKITATLPKQLSVWFWVSLSLFTISLFAFIARYYKYQFSLERYDLETRLQQNTERMVEQRQLYEAKLAERLPKSTTEELKANAKAKRYKMVTVLFSDIMGFSTLTSKDNPDKLVDDLDKFFFKFDQTVKKYNIQKIKAVGDSYMCAGGLPKKNRTNPLEVVLAALEMKQYIEDLKLKYPDRENRIWGLRIGIHTGPVFASKEGLKKQTYDIWGETVNIASRMESSGEIGKIHISGNTYELVRDFFLCNYHGKMPVKFQGDADMYYIENFRPHLSLKGKGFQPNEDFHTKLSFIRFDDLEDEILDLLEKKLPPDLYYHNVKHTIDVVTQVELIGRQEKITDNEMLLLKTAALFHDTGFTEGYKDHELLSIKLAKEVLPRYHYTPKQIEEISEIIFTTKLPPQPKTKLQEIICDADLDYLGRADFIPVSETLFKELVVHNVLEDNYDNWNKIQLKFIESHQYFTATAKKIRDVNKKKQLSNIRNQLKD